MTPQDADLLMAVRSGFKGALPRKLAVAVSGGGDSVALLHILTRCLPVETVALHVVTVDHGLRPEAADEAAAVGRLAQKLGLPHSILYWRNRDSGGNLQDKARRARYQLLADWAHEQGIDTVALGHTADDQAETFLMRLARLSGVDGLAAMRARRLVHGVTFQRPMLSLTRESLRDYLRRNALDWAEDPGNSDESYDRVKARKVMAALAPLGISATGLAEVAENMGQARDSLNWYAFVAARDLALVHAGCLVFDPRRFRTLPEEIARRLTVHAIRWITGSEYPPRRAPVAAMTAALRQERSATLGGCRILSHRRQGWFCREFKSVNQLVARPGQLWDGRWLLTGDDSMGCEVRALGRSGLAKCPNWRETGLPYVALAASPSVWRGDDLVSAPIAGLSRGWTAERAGGSEQFFATLLSH